MAATIATALKQLIEGLGLGLSAYRDGLPTDAKDSLPAVVVTDNITDQVIAGGDAGGTDTSLENVQVDLWEDWINYSDPSAPVLAESYTLRHQLKRGIHAAVLPSTPWHIYAVRVANMTRYPPDKEANKVRTRYSVNVYRSL